MFKDKYKVLVTTTTHIYIPDKDTYDEMIILNDFSEKEYELCNEIFKEVTKKWN
mgnify:CR=1 FL=1